MEAIDFSLSENTTPITNGHRALTTSNKNKNSLYTESEFRKKSLKIPTGFVFEKIVPALINSMEQNIAHRLTAAAVRANRNASLYDMRNAGPAEIATEILFDPKLVKVIARNTGREEVFHKIKKLNKNRQPLLLGIPLFSRKPVSPIKNRGRLPDIGDIHSIIRCAELAKLLSWVHDYDINISVFSDGFKYQRACGTPGNIISDYQKTLRFWTEKIGIDKYVSVINYEDAVAKKLGVIQSSIRDEIYFNTYHRLVKQTRHLFNPNSLYRSFHSIEAQAPLGSKLRYVFLSIASSVFYKSDDLGNRIIGRSDLAQNIFVKFMSDLYEAIQSPTSLKTSNRELMASLILEAWDAALKYMAISLTDHNIDIWNKLQPHGIKLTIHGKPDEIQIRPTNSKFPTMTSQHSVGGIIATRSGAKITCEYRIEREAAKEIPILLETTSSTYPTNNNVPYTIRKMIDSEQPFCYVPENVENIYQLLSGSYTDA
ncbi:L-tyrosine/L-tryptophan isonitrile synthase family protein [Erwinia sp. AnSW2-5]|uniref:L-tyrosine/L-tryptophan isonitrile synthase family protein n=1 Tax=Erwinia sp. AnSW2-5 TaxID=3367692 RepID=UPI00385F29E1